jgi:hypothetical protein
MYAIYENHPCLIADGTMSSRSPLLSTAATTKGALAGDVAIVVGGDDFAVDTPSDEPTTWILQASDNC